MKDPDRHTIELLAGKISEGLRRGDSLPTIGCRLKELAQKGRWGVKRSEALAFWCLDWTIHGRPHVMVDATLAASLMATSIPDEFAGEIRVPWKHWMVTIPAGLMHEQFEMTVFVDQQTSSDMTRIMFHDRRALGDGPNPGDGYQWFVTAPWAEFAAADPDALYEHAVTNGDAEAIAKRERYDERRERALRLVCRLAFGVCAELHNRGDSVSGGAARTHARRTRNEAPSNWTIRLGRPIRVDAKEYVRSYLGGDRSGLSVQYWRRGHWRRQAYGQQHALRKFIHIEPHWVGRDDAPIAVRSHVLADRKETT